jgi:hypothetical protein
MKEFRQKLEDVLAEQFGVGREFTAHLMPILEAVAGSQPRAEDWERALACVAAAYRSRTEELDALDETRVLVRQFVSELKRMDESLKVLGVYLERLRETLTNPTQPRIIH